MTKAGESVIQREPSPHSSSELPTWLKIVATNKLKLYLDAMQWFEWYADTHAEKSPMSLTAYLPRGRKNFYSLLYERDRRSRGCGLCE